MENQRPWQVLEPQRMLTEVLRRVQAEPDDVLVAVLRTGGDQEVLDATRVHRGPSPDQYDASQLLRRHAEDLVRDRAWSGERWAPPERVLMTVVCRRGRVVPMAGEYFWLGAWLYSNHLTAAYNGDVYLVTEHGWTGCMDKRAGFEPRLSTAFVGSGSVEGRQRTDVS